MKIKPIVMIACMLVSLNSWAGSTFTSRATSYSANQVSDACYMARSGGLESQTIACKKAGYTDDSQLLGSEVVSSGHTTNVSLLQQGYVWQCTVEVTSRCENLPPVPSCTVKVFESRTGIKLKRFQVILYRPTGPKVILSKFRTYEEAYEESLNATTKYDCK
jgi:hypothetical protein